MLRIFVVDDSKEDLLLAERILRQCKILNPISLFSSADAFINHVQKLQQAEKPEASLIFLDVVMAPTTGLDLLRYLQTSPYAKHSVVVLVSGLTDIKAMREGYHLGAKTFLLKPIAPTDVVEVVNSLQRRVSVEPSDGGYTLVWNERDAADTDILTKNPRMMSLSI